MNKKDFRVKLTKPAFIDPIYRWNAMQPTRWRSGLIQIPGRTIESHSGDIFFLITFILQTDAGASHGSPYNHAAKQTQTDISLTWKSFPPTQLWCEWRILQMSKFRFWRKRQKFTPWVHFLPTYLPSLFLPVFLCLSSLSPFDWRRIIMRMTRIVWSHLFGGQNRLLFSQECCFISDLLTGNEYIQEILSDSSP